MTTQQEATKAYRDHIKLNFDDMSDFELNVIAMAVIEQVIAAGVELSSESMLIEADKIANQMDESGELYEILYSAPPIEEWEALSL